MSTMNRPDAFDAAPTVTRLCREFAGVISQVEIQAVVVRCADQLCCAPRCALPELTERLARQRLTSRLSPSVAATGTSMATP